MAKVTKTVKLGQSINPHYNDQEPNGIEKPNVYKVLSTTNTIYPAVDQWLKQSEVERMIQDGYQVQIVPNR